MTAFLKEYERVALFIDGPNLHNSSKSLGVIVDYNKLLQYFDANARLVRANFYTAIDDAEDGPLRKLIDWMSYNGYAVHTKPSKQFTDEFGAKKVKGNMDVDITVDMLETAKTVDHIVLFSGDGDFRPVVSALQRMGKKVTAISSKSVLADELRRQVDRYIDLADIQSIVARPARQ